MKITLTAPMIADMTIINYRSVKSFLNGTMGKTKALSVLEDMASDLENDAFNVPSIRFNDAVALLDRINTSRKFINNFPDEL
jgi:hypothetical protein